MPLHNKTGKQGNKRYHRKQMAIQYADEGNEQIYGTVDKPLGNCSFLVNTNNGEQKNARLSGVMKKQGRVKKGDIVLIEPMSEDVNRMYQIIFRYTNDQVKILEREGHMKKIVEEKDNEEEGDDTMGDNICFEDEIEESTNQVEELDESFVDNI